MNKLVRMLLVAGSLVLLAACTSTGTLNILSSVLGGGNGMSDAEKAEAVVKSARTVAKSFEDITPEQEYYIGRAVGAVVLDRYRPYTNQEANHYLNVLGRILSLVSDRPETFGGYHFLILDSKEINAFATPSGLIFVSLGMLRCASSEDTVAAILAHEIGHIELKHGLKAIKTSRITTALTSAALTGVAVAGSKEMAELTTVFGDSITDIASTMINSGYSRSSEVQADKS
ncbi:MAG: M48 family metalloprotease, partial [Spirochaetia bacterium]